MSLPHGFPHCCKLFAPLYAQNKHLDMASFFSKPLEFLNETMESLMMDGVTGPLLREMLRHDGSLDLDSVTDDERRFQYTSAAETLTGTYLSLDSGIVTFHHPSVYDSAAFVVCKKDPMFVIKHCSLSFLNERLIFSDLESETVITKQCTVEIDNKYVAIFLNRLKLEYGKGHLSLILSHQSFHDEGFVTQFMKCILPPSEVQPLSDSLCDLFNTRDKTSKESFLFLMTNSKSDKILKYVCRFVQLTLGEQTETMFGICEHSSASSLEYFLSLYRKFDIHVCNSEQQTPLLVASTKSSGPVLRLLLERDVDVSIQDRRSCTALHNICRYGVENECGVVKMLIDKGACVNSNFHNYPLLPLHIACYEGHRNVVIALLQCGVDVNLRNILGETPLQLACKMRHLDTISVLLDRGADIDRTNVDGHTSLHLTCSSGHVDVVTLLLGRGADTNKTNSDGSTPLHIACRRGYVDAVTLLMDRGAVINKTNSDGDTPLHIACYRGHVDAVAVLLDRRADINKTKSDGDTPLHRACYMGHVYAVALLLDRGADIYKTNSDGDTPLHRACYMGHVDAVTVLLDRGADINKINSDGDTPFHKACFMGQVEAMTLLLDRGADINETNSYGYTPLHRACFMGLVDAMTLLLDRKADINKTNICGNTPLHIACYSGHADVLALLLDRGADIYKTNSYGDTPLHRACYMGHVASMALLLDRRADINKTNSDGDTPLHIACYERYVNVVTLLLDKGADINKENNVGKTPLFVANS